MCSEHNLSPPPPPPPPPPRRPPPPPAVALLTSASINTITKNNRSKKNSFLSLRPVPPPPRHPKPSSVVPPPTPASFTPTPVVLPRPNLGTADEQLVTNVQEKKRCAPKSESPKSTTQLTDYNIKESEKENDHGLNPLALFVNTVVDGFSAAIEVTHGNHSKTDSIHPLPVDSQVNLTFVELTGIEIPFEKKQKRKLPLLRGARIAITDSSQVLRHYDGMPYIPSCPLQIHQQGSTADIVALWDVTSNCISSSHATYKSSQLVTKHISLNISLVQNGQLCPFGVATLNLSDLVSEQEKSLHVQCSNIPSKKSSISVKNKLGKITSFQLTAGTNCMLRVRVDLQNKQITEQEKETSLLKSTSTSSSRRKPLGKVRIAPAYEVNGDLSIKTPQSLPEKKISIVKSHDPREKGRNVLGYEAIEDLSTMTTSIADKNDARGNSFKNSLLDMPAAMDTDSSLAAKSTNETVPSPNIEFLHLPPPSKKCHDTSLIGFPKRSSKKNSNILPPLQETSSTSSPSRVWFGIEERQGCITGTYYIDDRGLISMSPTPYDITSSNTSSNSLATNQGCLTGKDFIGERRVAEISQAVDKFALHLEEVPGVSYAISRIQCKAYENRTRQSDEDFETLENESLDDEIELDIMDIFEELVGLTTVFEAIEDALFGCHAGSVEHTEFFTQLDAKASSYTDGNCCVCDDDSFSEEPEIVDNDEADCCSVSLMEEPH